MNGVSRSLARILGIATDEAFKSFQEILRTCRKTLVKISGIEEYSASLSSIKANTNLLC